MPIYEYKCKKCDKTFDLLHDLNEPSVQVCLYCQGEAIRIFQANPIVFKGSGFYKTDYKGKTNKMAKADKKRVASKEENEKKATKDKKKNKAANQEK